MKKTISSIIFLIQILFVNAQSPSYQWAKQIGSFSGEEGRSIVTDPSGNIYTTGSFKGVVDFDPSAGVNNLSASGLSDIFVAKFDTYGTFIWAKQIGGAANDKGCSIALDSLGNIYTTGYFRDTVDFDPGVGIFNLSSGFNGAMFILKLDSMGDYVWSKSMNGTIGSGVNVNSIAIDGSGNVYTTGTFYGTVDFLPGIGISNLTSAGGNDIFVLKMDVFGYFDWVKQIQGPQDQTAWSIATDASDNLYITGWFNGFTDFNPDIATYYLTAGGFSDVFILKLDSYGNFAWAKKIGGTDLAYAYSVAIDTAGNVYAIGEFYGTVDFDPGIGIFNLSTIGMNVFVIKLDHHGNFIWAKDIGGTNSAYGRSIILDAISNVYITGIFSGTTDFNPGTDVFNSTSAGGLDIFISKLDSSGNFSWAKVIGGVSNDAGHSMTLDKSNNLFVIGSFNDTVDFDSGDGIFNLNSSGNDNMFILKLGKFPVGLAENQCEDIMSIYPNPVKTMVAITIPNPTENLSLEVYNYVGTLVFKQKKITEQNFIDLSSLANGIYLVKLMNKTKVMASQKILKE